jgi:hypothetical protein
LGYFLVTLGNPPCFNDFLNPLPKTILEKMGSPIKTFENEKEFPHCFRLFRMQKLTSLDSIAEPEPTEDKNWVQCNSEFESLLRKHSKLTQK